MVNMSSIQGNSEDFTICTNCGEQAIQLGNCNNCGESACKHCGEFKQKDTLIEHLPEWCWNIGTPASKT